MALTSSSYFEMASLVGSVAGFTVSVIANYILSFKFVFERKEDLNKKRRIHYLRRPFPDRNAAEQLPDLDCSRTHLPGEALRLQQHIGYNLIYTIAKSLLQTAVVMVYNFITRKIFLEKKMILKKSLKKKAAFFSAAFFSKKDKKERLVKRE